MITESQDLCLTSHLKDIHPAGAKFDKDVRPVGKNQEKQGLSFLSTYLLFSYTTGNKCFSLQPNIVLP